jgi:general secretion pathway protein A
MYNSFFGFRESPFSLSPDPSFLFRSPSHEEALANLTYGVQSRKGFIALTGEVGTGKTTMLECLRDHLGAQEIVFAFIFNSRLTPDQLFEMIAYDFALPCTHYTKTEVLFSLNNMLLDRARLRKTSVLIIDEAHLLDFDVLEEVRLLGNLENRQGKLLQIILSGQPELDAKLDMPRLRQLKQRIALRYSLRPLNVEETGQYIGSRLAHAGLRDQTVFAADVIRLIHRKTGGIPRLINLVCDNALLTAFAMSSRLVTSSMIDEVASDLRLEPVRPVPSGAGEPALPARPS